VGSHGHWRAVEALHGLSQCVLLDSVEDPDVAGALRRAQGLLAQRYVVDLAWLRSTPWRERIAALFDQPSRRSQLAEIAAIQIRNVAESGASALLLCGWLTSRLGWERGQLTRDGHGRATGAMGEVAVTLESVVQDVPGLGGITIGFRDGSELSLDRGPGGLTSTRRDARGGERRWRLLGASRGEGGILGEGIRQSLLRDPTIATHSTRPPDAHLNSPTVIRAADGEAVAARAARLIVELLEATLTARGQAHLRWPAAPLRPARTLSCICAIEHGRAVVRG